MSILRHSVIVITLLIITPIPRAGAHGFIDQQIASLSEQIDDAPRSLNLRLKRANLYREIGNMDSARSDIRFILTLEPGQAEALLVLARLERESKNFEVAQLAIDEFIAKHPGHSFALKERAHIFSEANQWNQAAEAWQTYLESATNPDSESFLACSEAIQNQNQQSTNPRHALEVIDEGLKLHPHVVSLNQRMASLLIQNGDFERAQKYFIASRKKYPTLRPRLFMEEARIWQSYGWSNHALIAYSNAQKSFNSLPLHKKLMPGVQALKNCIDKGVEMNR